MDGTNASVLSVANGSFVERVSMEILDDRVDDMLIEAKMWSVADGVCRKTYAISLFQAELEGKRMVEGLYGSD